MKARVLALFLGVPWTTFYVNAAEIGPPPAASEKTGVVSDAPTVPARPAVAIPGEVARALFTTDIVNLEPVDTVSTLTNDKTRVSYFTVIEDMAGQTVVHRWEYKDKVLLEMPFEVGSSHWRIYSTKTLDPSWLGEWKASVVDAAGGSLSVNTFTYMQKPDNRSATSPVTPKAAR